MREDHGDLPTNEELNLLTNEPPGGWDEEDKSHGVGEETRGQEHDASHQYQCSIDQFSRWHPTLGKIPLNIPHNRETLLSHHRRTQYRG